MELSTMRGAAIFFLASSIFAEPLLTPRLAEWRREIEKLSGSKVSITYVEWDREANTYSLPPDAPSPALFAAYLKEEEFARDFQHVHGLMAAHRPEQGPVEYLIFLNLGWRAQWGPFEEALLAHELFHAWLHASQYPAPRRQSGKAGCLSLATADLVQHVVMRAELEKRGINHAPYQRSKLEWTLRRQQQGSPPDDPCLRVKLISEWVDHQLELGPVPEYEALIRRWFPGLEPVAQEIASYLVARNLSDKTQHREALSFVFYRLRGFWDTGK